LGTVKAVHELAVQDKVLKVPAVEHVAVPPPDQPTKHVTVTTWPVVPVTAVEAKFELATVIEVHELAEQVGRAKSPLV